MAFLSKLTKMLEEEAARLARAEAMGFDTNRKLFHGTRRDFSAFGQIPHRGTASYMGIPVEVDRHGIFLAEDPSFANEFAKANQSRGNQPNVMPLFARTKRTLDLTNGYVDTKDVEDLVAQGTDRNWIENYLPDPRESWEAFDEENGRILTQDMRKAGFDSARILEPDDNGNLAKSLIVLDPKNIRSIFAKFKDPDSDDILAALPLLGGGVLTGGLLSRLDRRREQA